MIEELASDRHHVYVARYVFSQYKQTPCSLRMTTDSRPGFSNSTTRMDLAHPPESSPISVEKEGERVTVDDLRRNIHFSKN